LKTLSPEARDRVFASVQDDSLEGFAPGYEAIVERRRKEMDAGTAKTMSHEEVMSRLREKIGHG
jgi:hypothetical protein